MQGISAAKVCRVLEDFVVDWYFDRLNGSREAFSHPEEVLQTVVDLANDPHVGGMLYDGRYGSGPRSLNFNFYQMIFSLTVRADGWTGMEDPDNQIAEIAENYLGRIQKMFSAQEWKSRYD
jgi:predicted RNA binding protein YcfA (HicA-like mRNA interferase family)